MHTVVSTVIAHAPQELCYKTWADFGRFPKIMSRVKDVRQVGENQWHWEVNGPFGQTATWDAHIVLMEPNKVISWSSGPDADVANSGSVNFLAQGDDRTLVEVKMTYSGALPPLGELVADALRVGESAINESLTEFKTYVEREYAGTSYETDTVSTGTGRVSQSPATPMHSDEEVRKKLQGIHQHDILKKRD